MRASEKDISTIAHLVVQLWSDNSLDEAEVILQEYSEYRNRGIARVLCEECEAWAKELGCTEFASDCELTNTESLSFHMGLGFKEENRIICFKKTI